MKSSSGHFPQQVTLVCYLQALQFQSLKVDIFKFQAYPLKENPTAVVVSVITSHLQIIDLRDPPNHDISTSIIVLSFDHQFVIKLKSLPHSSRKRYCIFHTRAWFKLHMSRILFAAKRRLGGTTHELVMIGVC